MFTDFFYHVIQLVHSLMHNAKKEHLIGSVVERILLILFKLEDLVI